MIKLSTANLDFVISCYFSERIRHNMPCMLNTSDMLDQNRWSIRLSLLKEHLRAWSRHGFRLIIQQDQIDVLIATCNITIFLDMILLTEHITALYVGNALCCLIIFCSLNYQPWVLIDLFSILLGASFSTLLLFLFLELIKDHVELLLINDTILALQGWLRMVESQIAS